MEKKKSDKKNEITKETKKETKPNRRSSRLQKKAPSTRTFIEIEPSPPQKSVKRIRDLTLFSSSDSEEKPKKGRSSKLSGKTIGPSVATSRDLYDTSKANPIPKSSEIETLKEENRRLLEENYQLKQSKSLALAEPSPSPSNSPKLHCQAFPLIESLSVVPPVNSAVPSAPTVNSFGWDVAKFIEMQRHHEERMRFLETSPTSHEHPK